MSSLLYFWEKLEKTIFCFREVARKKGEISTFLLNWEHRFLQYIYVDCVRENFKSMEPKSSSTQI